MIGICRKTFLYLRDGFFLFDKHRTNRKMVVVAKKKTLFIKYRLRKSQYNI